MTFNGPRPAFGWPYSPVVFIMASIQEWDGLWQFLPDASAAFMVHELRREIVGNTLRGVSQPTFATWGNSGIEPDKGKGISSPGTYEASLMWPCNDGERQWNTMSDWTYR